MVRVESLPRGIQPTEYPKSPPFDVFLRHFSPINPMCLLMAASNTRILNEKVPNGFFSQFFSSESFSMQNRKC